MAKVPILIALLPQLLCTLLEVSGQQSPCQYFMYTFDPTTNEVTGQIQIPSPPKKVELHLVVTLSIAIELPTNNVSQLELAQSKEESVRAVEQGPDAIGQIVSSIRLEHTLYPPNELPLSQSISSNDSLQNPNKDFLPAPQPTSQPASQPIPQQTPQSEPTPVYTIPPIYTNQSINTQRPPNQPVITQSSTKRTILRSTTISSFDGIGCNPFFGSPVRQNNHYECGISTYRDNINLLISGKIKTSPGEWPWLAAIFIDHRRRNKFELQCAGSILTNKHVITAAYCFKQGAENGNIPSSAIIISLGQYQLREWQRPGSVNREITKYVLHPDYVHQESGDSDLAIAILKTSIEFSPTIKPICMWFGSIDLQSISDKTGYVVGWDRGAIYESGNITTESRMVKMSIIKQERCFRSHTNFVHYASNRTFCAGSRYGSGFCNGVSGSGFILYDAFTDRYQLRGIISRSLSNYNRWIADGCRLIQYVVFVDVAKYLSWIQQQLSIT